MEKRVRRVQAEFRAAPELGDGVAEAYVAVYDTEYKIGRNLFEQIDERAFEAVADGKTSMPIFYEHAWAAGPIGHQTFRSDAKGLKATQTYYLDDPRARSVFRALKEGALREHSIGFIPAEDGIEIVERSAGRLERIRKGDLLESSVVVRGANPGTETLSTRAVVPGAPAPAAVDPATGLPVEGEEEKPTKAQLLAQVAEAVQLAIDLDMAEALPKIVKQYLDLLVEAAPAPVVDPNTPPAAPTAPAAPPAARSFPADLSPSLFRALSV